jgi:hypothetical protein
MIKRLQRLATQAVPLPAVFYMYTTCIVLYTMHEHLICFYTRSLLQVLNNMPVAYRRHLVPPAY